MTSSTRSTNTACPASPSRSDASSARRAGVDPFPSPIRVYRGRRRTVELSIESGRLVARAPLRISRLALEQTLEELRPKLWDQLQRQGVFDDRALKKRADLVVRRFLRDQRLPPFTVCFSRRQHRRWGSCTVESDSGRVRVTARLAGHPNWVLDHVLLHELIHLVHPHHGPQFQELLGRDPRSERAAGYLEALETIEQLGMSPGEAVTVVTLPVDDRVDLPLFPSL